MIAAMSVLLALGSCGAPKETVTSCRSLSVGEVKSAGMTDSVMQTDVTVTQSRHSVNGTARTTVMEQSQTVPESSATLTVTMTNLRDLPEGASYRASDGRAGIELMRHGDEICATGHCDSVSRLYRYYFDMNLRQSETVDSLMWELDRSRAKQATLARELAGLKAGEAVSEKPPCMPVAAMVHFRLRGRACSRLSYQKCRIHITILNKIQIKIMVYENDGYMMLLDAFYFGGSRWAIYRTRV